MTDSRERLFRVLTWAGLILGIGLAYALLVHLTGWAVPCLFHTATGLWCPGCGVSRGCMAVLRGEWLAAIRANVGIAAIAPFAAGLLAVRCVRYVRTGKARGARWEEIAWLVLSGAMVVFGVLRNLPWFSFLAPQ